MSRRVASLLIVLAALLGAPPTALADASDDFVEVFEAFQGAGAIAPCKFSAKKLTSAQSAIPPDIETYAPDFPDALDTALAQRAGGACAKGSAGATATPPAVTPPAAGAPPAGSPPGALPPATAAGIAGVPGTTPAPAADAAPSAAAGDAAIAEAAARAAAGEDAGAVPFPLVMLGLLALVAVLVATAWGVARSFAFDPPWLVRGRHATAEAGWRTSAAWADFADWVRLGR